MMNSYPASEDEMSPFVAIVLEVSNLLEQRPEDATHLSFKEREIIKEGLNYLKLIRAGQETVQSSGASIVAGDDSLSAYEETSRALRWAHSPDSDPRGKKQLLNTSIRVLSALLDGKALDELEPQTVEQTRVFFRTMEDYYFSGHPFHSEGLFDRSYSSEE